MAKFSERYGYTKVSDVIIREKINEPIKNTILNWCYELEHQYGDLYYELEKVVWVNFLNRRRSDYVNNYMQRSVVISPYVDNSEVKWYEILDLVEFSCNFLKVRISDSRQFTDPLNKEFERHNFAYRIIGTEIVEISSNQEIKSIETAINHPFNGVQKHLQTALKLMSVTHEEPDYRNSIKESISAVEVLCREITGEQTLGQALGRLEANGVDINLHIRNSIDKLYAYTNDKSTGIRHAQMDSKYAPTADEAIFMLVSCSAFINYLTKKSKQTSM